MKTKLEENYENIVSNERVRSKFSWYQKGDKKINNIEITEKQNSTQG